MPEPITVFFLGTGGSTPFSGRKFPCIAIKYKRYLLLFDAGECCQFSLMGSNIHPLRHELIILLSHFHADHTSGLPGLLHTFSLMEMRNTVTIVGPEGLSYVIKKLAQAFFIPPPEYPLKLLEIGTKGPNRILDFDDFYIYSFPTLHSIPSLGYVFQEKDRFKFDAEKADKLGIPHSNLRKKLLEGKEIWVNGKRIKPNDVIDKVIKGRKIVYTGDTAPTDNVILFSEDADLLIHEATYLDKRLADERLHTSLEDAVSVAKKARVKRLALVHVSSRHEIEEYLNALKDFDIRGIEIILPRDGDSITI